MFILWWIIVGLIAGWLTGKIMSGGGYGPIMDIVVGQPTGDEPHYNPPKYEHTSSFFLFVREALVATSLRTA